jgi:hypothetical protein
MGEGMMVVQKALRVEGRGLFGPAGVLLES